MYISNYTSFCINNIYESANESFKEVLFQVFILYSLNLLKKHDFIFENMSHITIFFEGQNGLNLRILLILFLDTYFPELYASYNNQKANQEDLLRVLIIQNERYKSILIERYSIRPTLLVKSVPVLKGGSNYLLKLYQHNMKGGNLFKFCQSGPCKHLRNFLEFGLEPNHDFGGTNERRALLGEYFENYKTESDEYLYDSGKKIVFAEIDKYMNNDVTIRNYHIPNISRSKINKKISIKELFDNPNKKFSSGWENDFFRYFFTNGYFKAVNTYNLPDEGSDLLKSNKKELAEYMQKFTFFSGKVENDTFYQYSLSVDTSQVPGINLPIVNRTDIVASILQLSSVNITKIVRDTNLSSVGASTLITELEQHGITHELQINNVWDSANQKYANYKSKFAADTTKGYGKEDILSDAFRNFFVGSNEAYPIIKIFDTVKADKSGLSIGIRLLDTEFSKLNKFPNFKTLFEEYKTLPGALGKYYILKDTHFLQEGYNVAQLSFMIRILNLDDNLNCSKQDNPTKRGFFLQLLYTKMDELIKTNAHQKNKPILLNFIIETLHRVNKCDEIISEYTSYSQLEQVDLENLIRILMLFVIVKEDIYTEAPHIFITRLLLDFKKSGDWGLISKVLQLNQLNASNPDVNPKYLFLSNDNLCALFSILCGNPTLFGGKLFSEKGKTHLGLFIGETEKPITYSELKQKMNITLSKVGCIGYDNQEILESSLDKLNAFIKKRQGSGELNEIFYDKTLFPHGSQTAEQVASIENTFFLNKSKYTIKKPESTEIFFKGTNLELEIELKIQKDFLSALMVFHHNITNHLTVEDEAGSFEAIKVFLIASIKSIYDKKIVDLQTIDEEMDAPRGEAKIFNTLLSPTLVEYEHRSYEQTDEIIKSINNKESLELRIREVDKKIELLDIKITQNKDKSNKLTIADDESIINKLRDYKLGIILEVLFKMQSSPSFKDVGGLKNPLFDEFLKYFNNKLRLLLHLYVAIRVREKNGTLEDRVADNFISDYDEFNIFAEIIAGIYNLIHLDTNSILQDVIEFRVNLSQNLATAIQSDGKPGIGTTFYDKNLLIKDIMGEEDKKSFGRRLISNIENKTKELIEKFNKTEKSFAKVKELDNDYLGIILNTSYQSLTSKVALVDIPTTYCDLVNKMIVHSSNTLSYKCGNFIFHLLRNNIFDVDINLASEISLKTDIEFSAAQDTRFGYNDDGETYPEFSDIIDSYRYISSLQEVIQSQLETLKTKIFNTKTKNVRIMKDNFNLLNNYLAGFKNIDTLIEHLDSLDPLQQAPEPE